jgi:hypothetical protein
MSPDSMLALAIMGVLLFVIVVRQFSVTLLEVMMSSRSGSTVLLLLAVVGLFYKNFFYSALAFSVLSVFLLKDLWQKYPVADARRLHQEVARDLARFDASKSVDLQWANKTAKHDSPSLYGEPHSPTLLVFPPSEELLHSMCG